MSPDLTDTLTSKIIETKLVEWKRLRFIQQDQFKSLSPDALSRLKSSILANDFTQPFYVWEHDGDIYCLDGRHRVLALNALTEDGYQIPDLLPATFIDCDSEKQAAKFVLLFSSQYAKLTTNGLIDFVKLYDLNPAILKSQVDIPGINQSFFSDLIPPSFDELNGQLKDKPASIKITFGSVSDLNQVIQSVENLISHYEGAYYSVSCGEL